jgi:NAD(P)-dependent dehydrogenase (short-subunit alcohol dehydrogenase family)
MQHNRESKTWFITGTSSGLGNTMTEMLLARGDRVLATVRSAGLDELEARYRERLHVATLDVTDSGAVKTVVDRAFGELGRIDVIVNNAGFGLFGAAEELNDEQIRRQIETNLVGSIAVIRAALPHLRAQGGGRVLQVSSEGGQIAYPNFSVYHATKWGIEGFVESVAQEVASFGIEFTLLEPGPTRTNFGSNAVRMPAMAAYENTSSGEIRRAIAERRFATYGDPERIARAMIDCGDRSPALRRVTFGSEPYGRIREALTSRLAELDAQKEIAFATDTVESAPPTFHSRAEH